MFPITAAGELAIQFIHHRHLYSVNKRDQLEEQEEDQKQNTHTKKAEPRATFLLLLSCVNSQGRRRRSAAAASAAFEGINKAFVFSFFFRFPLSTFFLPLLKKK